MAAPLTDEQIVEAYREHGTQRKAAEALGIAQSTVSGRLAVAAARGLLGTSPVLPGFRIAKVSNTPQGDWVQQRPDLGEPLEPPEGMEHKRVSALSSGDGRLIQKWDIYEKEPKSRQLLVEAIKTAFDDYKGRAELTPAPLVSHADLATIYQLADHHLGLYAWAAETGNDYDLDIGVHLLREAMRELVASTPPAEQAVILNLGDFFHGDNSENRTVKSGHALDVDTRYAKVLRVGVDLMVECIHLALAKHKLVRVRNLPGNHDPHTALALSVALAAFFHNDPRVTVDCDPSKFFWWSFGKVFVGATHGDEVKPEQFPAVMASMKPKEWGESLFRYGYFGHVHHRSKGGGEFAGVIWETFQTLAAKDSWHAGKGYSSGRSMTAITHHRNRGEYKRDIVVARPNAEDEVLKLAA
jgi:hypothetical protein